MAFHVRIVPRVAGLRGCKRQEICAQRAFVGRAIGPEGAARFPVLAETGVVCYRILDDESPVRVWREKRRLSQRALAEQAGVSASYLAEIETGKKPGSAEALRKLSRVLAVPMENLVSRPE